MYGETLEIINLTTNVRGFDSRQGLGYSLRHRVQALGSTQPQPIKWVTGSGGLSPLVKRSGSEADH